MRSIIGIPIHLPTEPCFNCGPRGPHAGLYYSYQFINIIFPGGSGYPSHPTFSSLFFPPHLESAETSPHFSFGPEPILFHHDGAPRRADHAEMQPIAQVHGVRI